MRITVREHHHGPLFDGRAHVAVNAFCDDAEEEIAEHGVNVIRTELATVLKHPTGRYQSEIQTERAQGDRVINDDMIVYGPWLEGTSERNRTTRFKGYATFRRMRAVIQEAAPGIAERLLGRFLGRMG